MKRVFSFWGANSKISRHKGISREILTGWGANSKISRHKGISREILTGVPFVIIGVLLTAVLGGSALAYEASAPEAGDLSEPEAISIAIGSMVDLHGFSPEELQGSYWINSGYVASPGEPERLWQVNFRPDEGVKDPREYDFSIDAETGEIVSSGWEISEDAKTGDRLTEADSDMAVGLAKDAIYAFYGLHPGALERFVPDIQYYDYQTRMSPSETSFEIYFLKADAQEPGHYYAVVSAETSTVLRVYYSVQEFG